jgi:hypothetical protein
MSQLTQLADGPHPAKPLFDELAFLLADRIAGMPRRGTSLTDRDIEDREDLDGHTSLTIPGRHRV